MKRCNRCDTTKPLDQFHCDRNRKDGRFPYCRECQCSRVKKWQAQQPPSRALLVRLKRYNLSLERYQEMLESQGGVCAICREPESTTQKGKIQELCIDHDHECCPERKRSCGLCVRALLCTRCNFMVGHSLDSPENLRSGADYIESFRAIGHYNRREWDKT